MFRGYVLSKKFHSWFFSIDIVSYLGQIWRLFCYFAQCLVYCLSVSFESFPYLVFVVQSLSHVWLFATPWTAACQASLSFTISQSVLKLMFIESVMSSTISSSVVPFSSFLQSFPASGFFPMSQLFTSGGQISPSNKYSGLISFRIDWFDLLAVQGFLRVFSNTSVQKHQFFGTQLSLWSNFHMVHDYWKNHKLWLYGPFLAKWYLCFLIHG